jgi:hypothetical protein
VLNIAGGELIDEYYAWPYRLTGAELLVQYVCSGASLCHTHMTPEAGAEQPMKEVSV